MASKSLSLEDIYKDYCDFIESCDKFNSFTRSAQAQKTKSIECEEKIRAIKSYKHQAINLNHEHASNQLFHMQCSLNAMLSSLQMWIELKNTNFNTSWSLLIDAQEYIAVAIKINDYEGVRNFEARLKSIEGAIFPGWALYNSPGFIETIGDCSICHMNFLTCDHIENEIYMGAMCQRINRKVIEFNHTALVENPRDRRCIITMVSNDDGEEIDYFTWEKTGKHVDTKDGRHFAGVIFKIPTLDYS